MAQGESPVTGDRASMSGEAPDAVAAPTEPAAPRRGRPIGAKNKPKFSLDRSDVVAMQEKFQEAGNGDVAASDCAWVAKRIGRILTQI